MKRVNITIDEALYLKVQKHDINLSALIRERLEDYFSNSTVTLAVSQSLRDKYLEVKEITNATDKELIPFIDEALTSYLEHKKIEIDNRINKLIKSKAK